MTLMNTDRRWMIILAFLLCLAHLGAEPGEDFFEKRIRPILVEHCYDCHSRESGKAKGGLTLDSTASIAAGGESGPVIIPGDSDASLLIQRVHHREPEHRMPPDYRLHDNLLEDLKSWVATGAVLPDDLSPPASPVAQNTDLTSYPSSWEDHWAFQQPELSGPDHHADWSRNPVDDYIWSQLVARGLSPSPRADWTTLIRRLYLDVIGMVPSNEEVQAFMEAPSLAAYDRLVDALLANQAFGEHWARMWLDVARYADSNGSDENLYFANAWRYRNYVIASMNSDKPYNQFLCEQLAGDQMTAHESGGFDPAKIIATGFLNLGPKLVAEQDKEKLLMDLVDEQMDVAGQAFLGLSIGCARCHDHKFDPFTQEDYYAMAGIFRSTRSMGNLDFVSHWFERSLESESQSATRMSRNAALKALDSRIQSAVDAARQNAARRLTENAREYIAVALADLNSDNKLGFPADAWREWIRRTIHGESEHWNYLFQEAGWAGEGNALYLDAPLQNAQIENLADSLAHAIRQLKSRSDLQHIHAQGVRGNALVSSPDSAREIPHSELLEPVEFTLSSWVQIQKINSGQPDSRRWIVSKNSNEWVDGHYALGIQSLQPIAYLNIGGGKENTIFLSGAAGSLKLSRWHNIAVVVSGSQAALYLDGHLVQQQDLPGQRSRGNGTLAIGKRPDNYNYFAGLVDEVALFDRALPDDAIRKLVEIPDPAQWVTAPVWMEHFDLPMDLARKADQIRLILADLTSPGGPVSLPEDPTDLYVSEEKEKIGRLQMERDLLAATIAPAPGSAIAVEDSEPVNLKMHVRGSHLSLKGDPIPRRFPMAHIDIPSPPIDARRSGRHELAQWMSSPYNPLTSRVIVNRLWQGCFGRGIVSTPNNFGRRGAHPTHPELLDWLALNFMENSWSIKSLLRTILTSATYMQDSKPDPEAMELDPDNHLLWRSSPRRMSVEQMRDSLLRISNLLEPAPPAGHGDIPNFNYVPGGDFFASVMDSGRRTIYLPIIRDRVHPDLEIFDFANPGTTSGMRPTTIVPLQALYFLNNSKVHFWARSLLQQVSDDPNRGESLFLRILNRPPHPRENEVLASIPSDGWIELVLALFASNEFIYRL